MLLQRNEFCNSAMPPKMNKSKKTCHNSIADTDTIATANIDAILISDIQSLLANIFTYLGKGNYMFVAPVCKSFRDAYKLSVTMRLSFCDW